MAEQRAAAAEEEGVVAGALANGREAARNAAARVAAGRSAGPARRGEQEVELEVVVAPLADDGAEDVTKPVERAGMRRVERVKVRVPVVAGEGGLAVRVAHEPVGVIAGEQAVGGDGERGEPEAGTIPVAADALRQGGHARGELGIDAEPVADGSLVAVIDLHQVHRDALLQ